MSMAVLYPQNCLRDTPQIRRHTGRVTRRQQQQQDRKRQNRSKSSTKSASPPPQKKTPLMMGQVKILRRGQDLPEILSKQPEIETLDPVSVGSNQSGSGNKVVGLSNSDPVSFGFYAGSAVVTSPPPSSLPLPAFSTKKIAAAVNNDDVASTLRRILGVTLS